MITKAEKPVHKAAAWVILRSRALTGSKLYKEYIVEAPGNIYLCTRPTLSGGYADKITLENTGYWATRNGSALFREVFEYITNYEPQFWFEAIE